MLIQLQLRELLPSPKEEKMKTKSKQSNLLQLTRVRSTSSVSVAKCASKQQLARRLNKECAESSKKRKKKPKNSKPRWSKLPEKSKMLRTNKNRKKGKGSTKRRNKRDLKRRRQRP